MQVFSVVADVERYSEFVPWCRAARVLERRSETEFTADLDVGFRFFSERYTSRVKVDHPNMEIQVCDGIGCGYFFFFGGGGRGGTGFCGFFL